MTFPLWIDVGALRVHPHLFFELLAYLAAALAYWRQRALHGDHLSAPQRWALAAAAVVGAVAGSRILFWLENPRLTLAQIGNLQYLAGGQTIVGGLIGGWLAVEWRKRRLGIQEPTGDLFAVPIALGTAIGRIGCFLTGLSDGTHGLPTTSPWGIDLGDGVARHPTALYESLVMFGLAWWLWRMGRTAARGAVFLALMTAYLTFRFAVDFLKPGVVLAAGLTSIQWAALGGLALCVQAWVTRRAKAYPGVANTA